MVTCMQGANVVAEVTHICITTHGNRKHSRVQWRCTFAAEVPAVCSCCAAACRGRVLVCHPHSHTTHVVASGFYYSDGIAVSDDGSYLLVVETDALRVIKLWLTGAKVCVQCIHSGPVTVTTCEGHACTSVCRGLQFK